jgi:cyclase
MFKAGRWPAQAPMTGALAAALLAVLLSGCDYDVQPLRGTEGRTLVYAAVGRLGAPNAGIILTSNGALVVDPGLCPDWGGRLNLDALRRSKTFWDSKHRGPGQAPPTLPPPVLYVLNTTYRASHTFGNQSFLPTAEIIASEKAGKHMANASEVRNMRELLRDRFKVPGLQDHYLVEPTITFDGALTIRTPEVEVKLLAMGDCVGEGDAVVYLPQQKVLFAGDLVLVGFVPYYEGRTPSVRNWIAALKKLEEQMDDDVQIVPGHGPVGGKELLKQQREFLGALAAAVNACVAARKSVDETVREVKLPNYAKWQKYDEWLGENVRLIYQELTAPAAPRAAEAAGGGAMAEPAAEAPDRYR